MGAEVDQKGIEAVGFMKIGEFMWHWIMLEEAVNNALLHVLGISGRHIKLLRHFIGFSSRLGIIETAIPLAFHADVLRKTMAGTIHDVRRMYADRNMVAHSVFGPVEDKPGVGFWDYRGKKEVKLFESFWTFEEFDQKMDEMDSLALRIEELGQSIGNQSRFVDRLLSEGAELPSALSELFMTWAPDPKE